MFATSNTTTVAQRLQELSQPVAHLTKNQLTVKADLENLLAFLDEIGFFPRPDQQEFIHDTLEGWVLRVYMKADDHWGGIHCQAPGEPYKALQGSCREMLLVAKQLLTVCGFSIEGEKRRRKFKALIS